MGRFVMGRFVMGRFVMGRFLRFGINGNIIMGRFLLGRPSFAFLAICTIHFVPMVRFGLSFGQFQDKPAHLI